MGLILLNDSLAIFVRHDSCLIPGPARFRFMSHLRDSVQISAVARLWDTFPLPHRGQCRLAFRCLCPLHEQNRLVHPGSQSRFLHRVIVAESTGAAPATTWEHVSTAHRTSFRGCAGKSNKRPNAVDRGYGPSPLLSCQRAPVRNVLGTTCCIGTLPRPQNHLILLGGLLHVGGGLD